MTGINTFSVLQNRVAQIAKKFELSMEDAWDKLHAIIDRELGLDAATVQKVDGEFQVAAQQVEAVVVAEKTKVINTVASITATDGGGGGSVYVATEPAAEEPAPVAEPAAEEPAVEQEVPPTTGG